MASSSSNDRLELVAAALTSLIPGSKVITKDDPLYATLEDPKPLTYDILSKNVIVESRPEPEPGLVEPFEVTELDAEAVTNQTMRLSLLIATPTEKFTITVRFLNGQPYRFRIDPRATVYGLKWSIFKSKGFDEYSQYDVNNIVLTFEGTELNDDELLTDCGIKYMSNVTAVVKLRGASKSTMLVLDEDLLDPVWDYDFTHIDDKDREFKRGGHVYKRPCGWNRIALRVRGKYEDDKWLECFGLPGEWPVSYHGTKKERAEGIAKTGYDQKKWNKMYYGDGFYSTPDIAVAAGYATSFPFGGKRYKVVMQNRVNLSPGYTTIIPEEKTLAGAEYYVTPSADDLRAYGICIKEVSAYNFLC
ncbi:PREDICTED: uncharacterized protein LOC100639001 [Amphimedon queenslandica]|uniref:Ubiquitin-like domain-containing protein n=1 Tax=Amphimedon queenslandica TaxID=400682 RepID=A0A1X7T9T6_AMPQE|nr:PREDICTED: uncharacterized protein LOC100639001 [Amphimedon queenslandica]|eukprot:XP_003390909.1 PREDICTED: uncharacterized protein LOC100639001 [Amphimedon queenslandica]